MRSLYPPPPCPPPRTQDVAVLSKAETDGNRVHTQLERPRSQGSHWGADMATKGCLSVTKYFLFIFNIIFFLLGSLLFGFGLWILFDGSSFAAALGTSIYGLKVWSYILSGVGIITMFIGFLGCLGSLKEIKCMLGFLHCCGWDSYIDWKLNEDVQANASSSLYPCSCSNTSTLGLNTTHLENGFCSFQNDLGLFMDGCSRSVKAWLADNIITIVGICLGVALLERCASGLLSRSVSCRCRSFCVETWTRTTTSLSATLRSTPRWEHPTAPPTPQTRIIWTEMTPGSLWVCWGLVPCCPPTLSLSCAHPSGSGLGCCFFHPQAVV
ncbi:leukocyte antigen CD37 isoform X2 [Alligator mississippiensis]|uniref:leukocyte antigen CD37 isoform X2 n=1 Tax=Alligator mississippiensis TaxID=8496 RepID=UPI00090757B0|nr:leukocyte antigen CD37 isoform X2 [Alligator mississippiensis]